MDDIFGQLQQKQRGLSSLDLVDFTPSESKVMRLFLRYGHLSLAEVTNRSSLDQGAVRSMVDAFVEGGVLHAFQVEGEQHYGPHLARKRRRKVPTNVWAMLDDSKGRATRAAP